MGKRLFTRPGAGSANPAIVIVTRQGEFFLKRRNPRYSGREQLIYDHAVIKHLAASGLPVTPPVNTRAGSRWLEHESGIYELYPYAPGTQHTPGDVAQVAAAGAVLARFHEVCRDFSPPGSKFFARLFPPETALEGLLWARQQVESGAAPDLPVEATVATLDLAIGACRLVLDRLPDPAFAALPHTIVHGDWHPANLKFDGPRVVGVFDFDWVGRQPRVVDFVDGLLFFCSHRSGEMVAADIRTLTRAFTPDWTLLGAFGSAYATSAPLTPAEVAAVPDLMRARWLYSRVFAMLHKIPEPEKIGYLVDELDRPLRWIDDSETILRGGQWMA